MISKIMAAASCLLCGMGMITEASGQGIPDNDPFSAPTVVGELPAIITGSNQGSTLELGERKPIGYEDLVKASVWFEWTAPKSGTFRIDSVGSDFDTALAVWTGDQLADLVEQGSDDDFTYYDQDPAVAIQAIAGTTYRISLYGYKAERGNYVLRIFDSASLSGTILGPDGSTPYQDQEVSLYKWSDETSDWEFYSYTGEEHGNIVSDVHGQYHFIGLDEGYYKVRLYNPNSNSYEFWPGSPKRNASGVIRVDRGVAAEGIDFTLDSTLPEGRISGRVTSVNGFSPLSRVQVSAYAYNMADDTWLVCGSVPTYDDGTYEISGLPEGIYRVGFESQRGSGTYAGYYYGDAQDVESAADIVLESDISVVRDIDGKLPIATMLSGIELSVGTLGPVFNPALLNYGVQVSAKTASIRITPHLDSSRYSVRINGSFVSSGAASDPIPLAKGTNQITIEINEGGGAALRTYSILVTRGMLKQAALKSLVVNAGDLKPGFASDKTVYTVDVGSNTSTVMVQPKGVKDAIVSVNGKRIPATGEGVKVELKAGISTIDISVKNASDDSETIYRIFINRKRSADSQLEGLVIKGKGIQRQPSRFSPTRLNYKVQASKATNSLQFLAKPSYNGALVTLNGMKIGPKGRTANIKKGKTLFLVVVTAQDGSRKTYRVTVNKP